MALCVTVAVMGVFVRVGVFVCAPLGVRVGVWVAVEGPTRNVALAGEVVVTPFAVLNEPAGIVLM